MFRTVTVHPQELLFRCCMCRLWYVVRTALSDTSGWYNVRGRRFRYIHIGIYSEKNLSPFFYTKTADNLVSEEADGTCQGVLCCSPSIRLQAIRTNVMYRKRTAFPALNFTKHTSDQQQHVQISYTEFNRC